MKATTLANKTNINIALKYIVLIIPVLWGFFWVTQYGVNVFYWDDWEYMRNIDRFMTVDFLWAPHNEHRMLFPNLVTYFIGSSFSWSSMALMYTSQFFLFILYAVVVAVILNGTKLKEISWPQAALCLVCGICIHNLCQYENLLWGYQIAWYMIISLGTLSYYCYKHFLSSKKNIYLVFSMIFAVIVSFCSMHGFSVWVGYLCFIAASVIFKEKMPKRVYPVVLLTFAVTVIIYFYDKPSDTDVMMMLTNYPEQIIIYFLRLLSAAFFTSTEIDQLAALVGLIFFIAICASVIREMFGRSFIANAHIYGPLIMGVSVLLLISVGRWGAYTIPSRYTTNSSFMTAFFIIVCVKFVHVHMLHYNKLQSSLKDEKITAGKYISTVIDNNLPILNGVLSVCTVVAVCVSCFCNISNVKKWRDDRLETAYALANYSLISDIEIFRTHVYPFVGADDDKYSEDTFRNIFKMMEDNKWNVFKDDNSVICCNETVLPDATEQMLNAPVLDINSLSIDEKSIQLNLSLNGIERNILKNSAFYVILNDKTYNALYLHDTLRFIKSRDMLNEGVNSIEICIYNKKDLYKLKPLYFYNSAEGYFEVTGGQYDKTVLSGASPAVQPVSANIYNINSASDLKEYDIYNGEGVTLAGRAETNVSDSTECYIKIADTYFKAQWLYDDVTDEGCAFECTLVAENVSTGKKGLSVIIYDRDSALYSEVSTGITLNIHEKKNYVDIPEGIYIISRTENAALLVQNFSNCQLGLEQFESARYHRIELYSPGKYKIINTFTNEALDVQDASVYPGANVQYYEFLNTENQLWRFIEADDGVYYIESALGNCISADDNGNIITMSYDENSASQRWKIEQPLIEQNP